MSWLEKLLPPKIQQTDPTERRSVPEGLWIKCPACETVLYNADLAKNVNVCPKCSHHHRIGARARLDAFLDAEGRYEIGQEVLPVDPLKFKDSRKYTERLKVALETTGETDALVVIGGAVMSVPLVASSSTSWVARWGRSWVSVSFVASSLRSSKKCRSCVLRPRVAPGCRRVFSAFSRWPRPMLH